MAKTKKGTITWNLRPVERKLLDKMEADGPFSWNGTTDISLGVRDTLRILGLIKSTGGGRGTLWGLTPAGQRYLKGQAVKVMTK